MFRRYLFKTTTLRVKTCKPSWTNNYQRIQHVTFCSDVEQTRSKELEIWITKTLINKRSPSITVNEWHKGEDKLKELFTKDELNFKDFHYRNIIRTSLDSGKTRIVELIWDYMKKKCIPISSRTYNAILTGYIKFNFVKAVELFDNEIKPQFGKNTELNETIFYNTMISAYITRNKMEKAKILLDQMKQNDIKINAITYNSFFCKYFETENYEQVLQYLKEMEIMKCSPNEATINMFIKVLLVNKKAELAYTYFKEFFSNPGLKMTSVSYSTMLNGFFDCGYPLLAVRLFKSIPNDFKQKSTLYAIMIKRGFQFSIGAGEEYFNEMKNNNMIMSEVAYKAVINGYLRAGNFSDAEKLFKNLRERDFDFNGKIHASMASGYFEANQPKEAFAIITEMIQKNFTSCFTSRIFYCLVRYYVQQQRNITKALEILDDMEKKYHLTPWPVTFSPIIDYYGRLGNMEEAEKYKELSKIKSGHVHVQSYDALIKAYKKIGNNSKVIELSKEKLNVGFTNPVR